MKSHRLSRATRRVAAAAFATSLMAQVVAAAPAMATDLPTTSAAGQFKVRVSVANNGAAGFSLSDTITGAPYVIVVTSTGAGFCEISTAQIVITGWDFDLLHNPASASTAGGPCALYNASVTYTIEWTSLLGVHGAFEVECVWVLGSRICTPQELTYTG